MPPTIDVLRQARDKIVSEPESYEFMDYCHCLAGHVFLAATGEPYDEEHRADNFDALGPYRQIPRESPFGQAIVAMLHANGDNIAHNIHAARLSHLNTYLCRGHEASNEHLRRAAVRALDNTIAYLEGSS